MLSMRESYEGQKHTKTASRNITVLGYAFPNRPLYTDSNNFHSFCHYWINRWNLQGNGKKQEIGYLLLGSSSAAIPVDHALF